MAAEPPAGPPGQGPGGDEPAPEPPGGGDDPGADRPRWRPTTDPDVPTPRAFSAVISHETSRAARAILVPDQPVPSEWKPLEADMFRRLYHRLVRSLVLSGLDTSLAEDAVQEAFIELHRNPRYLASESVALLYLRRTAQYQLRSAWRKRAVERLEPNPPDDLPAAPPEEMIESDEFAIVSALNSLSDRQREAVVLRYYDDLPIAEVATVMGINRSAVSALLTAARAKLRSILESRGGGSSSA
jgi:RNA polymerase sigma factor (sigma-70 family)